MPMQTLESFLRWRIVGRSELIELGLSQKGNRKVEFREFISDFDFNEYVEYGYWECYRIVINPEGFVIDVQHIG